MQNKAMGYSDDEDIFSFAKHMPAKKQKTTERPKVVFQKSFALANVYKRLINYEIIGAHTAEGDCVMLMKCVIAIKDIFLPWARQNCEYLYYAGNFILLGINLPHYL